ncbi:hypothetical protein Thiowin_01644 [Thiorhodovibrio winogradskyi]|uniref:Uncharacterized protein n=1 Tax=Thiorhodovibrio winogradskyi TaxID=77007 RepID=A0ABZ0S9B2_9GAMM|nr:hypothetical protein [Thiorhodovibrio winogradskyi]
MTLPENASIHATEAAVEQLNALLAEDPDLAHWSTYVGQGAIRFYLPLNVQLPNPFYAQAVLVAKVLGLIPVAPTVFWGPMAFAIMCGLSMASLLTLIVIPTLYVTWESVMGHDLCKGSIQSAAGG